MRETVDIDRARALLDARGFTALGDLGEVGPGRPGFDWTPRLDRVLLELRARGLSYPALAVVLELYEGAVVTHHQVRLQLERLGAEKSETRARAARETHARRRSA